MCEIFVKILVFYKILYNKSATFTYFELFRIMVHCHVKRDAADEEKKNRKYRLWQMINKHIERTYAHIQIAAHVPYRFVYNNNKDNNNKVLMLFIIRVC